MLRICLLSAVSTSPTKRSGAGSEVRPSHRPALAACSSEAESALAPRRDGGSDRRADGVSLARRRSRGRGAGRPGAAAARKESHREADGKLLKTQGVRAVAVVTDKLRSCGAAFAELGVTAHHAVRSPRDKSAARDCGRGRDRPASNALRAGVQSDPATTPDSRWPCSRS
jgi:hypothetical protein